MAALDLIYEFMRTYGNWALFVGLALESLALPVFSEIVLAYAGYLIAIGALSFGDSLFASTTGSLCGAAIAYVIGRRGGRPLIDRYAGRLFRPERIEAFETRLRRSLAAAVFFGRMLSGVRSVSSYLGGIFRLPFAPFMLYSAAGSLVWCTGILVAGLLLGEQWQTVVTVIENWALPFTIVVVVAIAAYVAYRRLRRTAP